MKPAELGWALLLSVPVGVGVSMAVLKTSGGREGMLAAGFGLAVAVAVFLVVVAGASDRR